MCCLARSQVMRSARGELKAKCCRNSVIKNTLNGCKHATKHHIRLPQLIFNFALEAFNILCLLRYHSNPVIVVLLLNSQVTICSMFLNQQETTYCCIVMTVKKTYEPVPDIGVQEFSLSYI